jgi:competence protein ComEC
VGSGNGSSRLPAAAPSLLLVGGVLFAEHAFLAGALLSALALAAFRDPRGSRAGAVGVLSCLLLGALLEDHASTESARRTAWLPAAGASSERSLDAIVLRSPERDARGSRTLLVRGQGDRSATIRLVVAPSSESATASLDSLRRGDRVGAWCRLRLPPGRRPPSNEDPRALLAAQGIDAVGGVKNARLVRLVEPGLPSPLRFLDAMRAAALARLDAILPRGGRDRAVLGAMLLGERGGLDPRDLAALRDSGLLHVLAISGVNVTFAAALLLLVLRRLRLGPTALAAVAATGLAAFCFLVGNAPSVLRAVLAAAIGLLGRRTGRTGSAANALAAVAAVLAAARPAIVRDPGFQLSFLATAGIVLLAGPVARAIPLPRLPALALGASAGAYLTTAPVTAWSFCRVSPVALVSNLFAAPLAAGALLLGFLALVLGPVPLLGPAVTALAVGCVDLLLALARASAAVPGGTLRVAPPSTAAVAVYFLLLALAAGWIPVRSNGLRRVLRLVFALALVAVHAGRPPAAPGSGAAFVLDVGQGQAVALTNAAGRFVVVDAGGSAGGRFDQGDRLVAPFLAATGCRRIEALVLTHDHDDHTGGASSILRDFEVGELWIGAGAARDPATHALVAEAVARGTAVVLAERGGSVRRAGLSMEFLHPSREDARVAINDRCVVVRASAGQSRVLIPGDLESEGERRLLARGAALESQALVVGHHGAARSTSPAFLDAVAPSVAVVSVGAGNRFGHPAPATIDRVLRRGARLLRTDLSGTVVLLAAPWRWRVATLSELEETRNERHDGDQEEQDSDDAPGRSDSGPFVHEPRMPIAKDPQHDEPHGVLREDAEHEPLVGAKREHEPDRRVRDRPVPPRGQGVDGVASVELSDREEVQRREEYPEESRGIEVPDQQVRRGRGEQLLEAHRHERRSERRRVGRNGRDRGRPKEPDSHRDERDGEPGDRPRGRDVEQRLAVRNRSADADDGAERSERRDAGEKVRKRCGNPVPAARDVVTHLVARHDGQHGDRVLHGSPQVGRPGHEAGEREGEARDAEEERVQPNAAFRRLRERGRQGRKRANGLGAGFQGDSSIAARLAALSGVRFRRRLSRAEDAGRGGKLDPPRRRQGYAGCLCRDGGTFSTGERFARRRKHP